MINRMVPIFLRDWSWNGGLSVFKIASILLRVLFVRSVYAFCSQFRGQSAIWTSRLIAGAMLS